VLAQKKVDFERHILKLCQPEAGAAVSTEWPTLQPLSADESLYFLHIPKTAGTTLQLWMGQNFSTDEALPVVSSVELGKLPKQEIDRKRFIVGHFGISFGKHYRTPDRTVTWLRNPVERTISEYYYWKRVAALHPTASRVVGLPMTSGLEDCLADHEFSRSRANVQTRDLGNYNFDPIRFFVSDSELMSNAIRTVESMEFVGITEQMQLSVDMLNWHLGWRPTQFDQHENKSARSCNTSETSLSLAKEMNRLDLELYEKACEQLEQRYQAFLDDISRLAEEDGIAIPSLQDLSLDDYATVRESLEPCLWNRYHLSTRNEPRVTSLTYTFDMPLRGHGWREREGQRNMCSFPYRWMNQTRATIDLPLRRDIPLKIRFRVAYSLGQPIELSLDGTRIDLRQIPTWDRFGTKALLFEGTLPIGSNWETQLSTLTFGVPEVCRPCDLNPASADDRVLGVAIDWISIEP